MPRETTHMLWRADHLGVTISDARNVRNTLHVAGHSSSHNTIIIISSSSSSSVASKTGSECISQWQWLGYRDVKSCLMVGLVEASAASRACHSNQQCDSSVYDNIIWVNCSNKYRPNYKAFNNIKHILRNWKIVTEYFKDFALWT